MSWIRVFGSWEWKAELGAKDVGLPLFHVSFDLDWPAIVRIRCYSLFLRLGDLAKAAVEHHAALKAT